MEKKMCSKYDYPYPEDCVRCVYFMSKDNKVSFDFVVSRYPEGINEYIDIKTAFKHYRYLGSISKEMLKTLRNGVYNRYASALFSNVYFGSSPMNMPIENIESEILFEIVVSDLKNIEKGFDAVINGGSSCKTPIYIYSEEEANEALID